MHPLRALCHHLLQQLPQSPLPEVSDRGPRTLDRATSMWSSHFLRSSRHWPCRIRKSSTICCSAPVPKPPHWVKSRDRFFLPSTCSVAFFVASLLLLSGRPSVIANSSFMAT